MPTRLTVNGESRSVDAEPDTPLLYVLRNDFALNGAKFGCGLAQCGACTVLINGSATRSSSGEIPHSCQRYGLSLRPESPWPPHALLQAARSHGKEPKNSGCDSVESL